MSETYFYGQAEIEMAEILPSGKVGPYIWLGDFSEFSGSFSQTAINHRESYSGNKGKVREFFTELGMDWSGTLHQLSPDNVATFTLGKYNQEEAGTVTAEEFPTVADGDVVQLDHVNVSDLVIVDSAGSPVTMTPDVVYKGDEWGNVRILALPTTPAPTQPLKAAYSYGAYQQAAFLAGTRKNYALRAKGVNLAENGEKWMVEIYKVSAGLLQQLSLITSGNQMAGSQVTFSSLLDSSKPADGQLGQYGRYVTLG